MKTKLITLIPRSTLILVLNGNIPPQMHEQKPYL